MEWWGWVVVGALAALALYVLDRLVARGVFDRRGPKRFGSPGGAVAAGALTDLIAVFQPNHAHLVQEQQRRKGDLVQPGDGAPPLLDLVDEDEDPDEPAAPRRGD